MPLPLVTGTMLTCSFGSGPCSFVAKAGMPKTTDSQVDMATTDQILSSNISGFIMCSSMSNPSVASATSAAQGVLTPQACSPVISGTWTPGAMLSKLAGMPIATASDICNCAYGGVITVSSPVVGPPQVT